MCLPESYETRCNGSTALQNRARRRAQALLLPAPPPRSSTRSSLANSHEHGHRAPHGALADSLSPPLRRHTQPTSIGAHQLRLLAPPPIPLKPTLALIVASTHCPPSAHGATINGDGGRSLRPNPRPPRPARRRRAAASRPRSTRLRPRLRSRRAGLLVAPPRHRHPRRPASARAAPHRRRRLVRRASRGQDSTSPPGSPIFSRLGRSGGASASLSNLEPSMPHYKASASQGPSSSSAPTPELAPLATAS